MLPWFKALWLVENIKPGAQTNPLSLVASPINKNCSRCNAQLKHGFKTLKIEIDNIRSNLMPFSFLKIIASVNFNKIQKVFLLKNFLHRRSMNIASAQHLQQQQQQSQRNNHNNSYIRDLGCKTFLHRRSMNIASAQHLQQQQQSQRNNHSNSYIRDLGCKTFLPHLRDHQTK